jgi:ATP-dependent RNA helicase RhlE
MRKIALFSSLDESNDGDVTTFESLGITNGQLLENVRTQQNWKHPTPIQNLVIPAIFNEGNDNEMQPSIWSESPTGSGKTAAFALPIVQQLLSSVKQQQSSSEASSSSSAGNGAGGVHSLILCPTRELAVQIGQVFTGLLATSKKSMRGGRAPVVVLHGGVPLDDQVELLQSLLPDDFSQKTRGIVVATPGRLVHLWEHSIRLAKKYEDPTEAALEQTILEALDSSGRTDGSLSLAKLQKLEVDKLLEEERPRVDSLLETLFRSLEYLVVAEADRLLGRPFQKEMDPIFMNILPEDSNVRTLLFSATFPAQIQPRVAAILKRLGGGKDAPNPLRLSCSTTSSTDKSDVGATTRENDETLESSKESTSATSSTISLRAIRLEERHRTQALLKLVKDHGKEEWDRVLVFVATRYASEHVAKKLRRANIRATELHGKLDQPARERRLEDFKRGKVQVLIATDLASRGLDVVGLPAVVNYDLPRSTADFTHRVGRTGRAGQPGTAVSFITPQNEVQFDLIEKRHLVSVEREVLPGFEPDDATWDADKAATMISAPGVSHSGEGLAHDRMHGGIKGKRKSKKDRAREASPAKKESAI